MSDQLAFDMKVDHCERFFDRVVLHDDERPTCVLQDPLVLHTLAIERRFDADRVSFVHDRVTRAIHYAPTFCRSLMLLNVMP